MSDLRGRAVNLRTELNKLSYQYHVLDNPTVDDAVYDGLIQELKKIEEENPDLITPDSPTQRVGGKLLGGFVSVEHSQRMLSLNDIFNSDEVTKWYERILKLDSAVETAEYFADIKKDGLACALIYQNGVLVQGITRGDGYVGEDVTANIRTIQTIPLRLQPQTKEYEFVLTGRTEVRGEIVLYKKDFELLNESRKAEGLPQYANPRNLAAGTIRQLDPQLVAGRPLVFMPYDIIRENSNEIPTNEFAYKTLNNTGFVKNKIVEKIPDIKKVVPFAESWNEKRHDLPYSTDGLVVKLNDRALYARLGYVGKNPRGAIAYKYPAEQSTTKLKDIFISVGRTGAATPVAILEPVFIAGSTVQMATLHNEGEIARKDVRIGDTVVVQKAGDIIPEVVEPIIGLRDGSEKVFVMPKNCPDCNTQLEKKVADAVWRCPNTKCPARMSNHIQHFASKGALDIEGLGEKNVQALLEAGLINDTADLYNITVDQLLGLERFADISAKNLVEAIQAKKNPPLHRFLFGLGIRHVGAQTAVDLATNFRTLAKIAEANEETYTQVDGIGEVVAESLVAWFAEPENQELLRKFSENGVVPEQAKELSGPLVGKSFVVTGTLQSMSREAAAEKIRSLGGTFQSSVGKDTTYLVAAGKVGASKLAKAQKYGTQVIDEQKLLELIG